MTDLIGQSLGRYHILEQLGEGGMATVYKAFDTRLERDVAVKIIRTESLPQNAVARALKRFEREAKALGKLTHPNIVPISDYGEYEGKPYLVMPYLPGGTLKQKLGKPIPWQEAIRLLIPIARALDFAHRQGMIHRDVKPSNILITADGEPMLTDFGIAKVLDVEETMDLTGTSVAVGTPEYMAPEQATAKTADHRADIYTLGIVLYEMVTGRKPYQADTPMAVMIMHARDPLPRPSQYVRDLPDSVEKLLLKALAKDPAERYQSMAEMAAAIERLQSGANQVSKSMVPRRKKEKAKREKTPTQHKRITLAIISTALVVVLVGLFGMPTLLSQPENILTPTQTRNKPLPINTLTATTEANSTPTQVFTPTLSPTQTPIPTELIALHECFDNLKYENSYPKDKWSGGGCNTHTLAGIYQQNGLMHFSFSEPGDCSLTISSLKTWNIKDIDFLAANLNVTDATVQINNPKNWGASWGIYVNNQKWDSKIFLKYPV